MLTTRVCLLVDNRLKFNFVRIAHDATAALFLGTLIIVALRFGDAAQHHGTWIDCLLQLANLNLWSRILLQASHYLLHHISLSLSEWAAHNTTAQVLLLDCTVTDTRFIKI